MTFMCGCVLDRKLAFGYERRFDSEGFEVCPDHQLREQGWRTKSDIEHGKLIVVNRYA